ncbi:MAG: tyrosine--tRNA ligase, partial [Thermoleophilia bacterium]|nr:tyrosine--tRNA ligase [Thermoleophilia bacterium]
MSDHLRPLLRNAVDVLPQGALEKRLAEAAEAQRPLRVKLGLDPTAVSVTLGWSVVLSKLAAFQEAGHLPVLIVGDFTARVGDPSGKSKTRPMLTPERIAANEADYLRQFSKILDVDRIEIRHNSEWLGELGAGGLLDLAAKSTLAQMLERDDFNKRYTGSTPISLQELLYPLLQGYDSVAINADVEIGGTDQKFNLLVGRDLQEQAGMPQQS